MRHHWSSSEPGYVLLVRGSEELVVYHGELPDCAAWLVLNGDKPSSGTGHFELREGLPPANSTSGS